MALVIAPDSFEAIERAKWDRPKNASVDGVFGMRCVGYEEYPKVLYRAGRPTHGNVKVTDSVTAHSADQETVLRGQGWSLTQEAAIQAVHGTHVEHAKLAAERHYVERSMSERAQREAGAVDEQTVYHVPVIPETPVRKRPGRKPKTMGVSA